MNRARRGLPPRDLSRSKQDSAGDLQVIRASGGVRVLVDQAAQDGFSADVLCADARSRWREERHVRRRGRAGRCPGAAGPCCSAPGSRLGRRADVARRGSACDLPVRDCGERQPAVTADGFLHVQGREHFYRQAGGAPSVNRELEAKARAWPGSRATSPTCGHAPTRAIRPPPSASHCTRTPSSTGRATPRRARPAVS
jgi:hypothetical protein